MRWPTRARALADTSDTMVEKPADTPAPLGPTAHLAPLAQKELAPVNAAILLTTSLCTGVLTLASEFLGSGLQGIGPYIFATVWLLAILIIFALIGREHGNAGSAHGLARWTLCIRQGASVSLKHWQYSLLLLAVAALAGGTSYLNVKRSTGTPAVVYADTAVQQLTAQGYSLSDTSMWMALAEGDARAIELARAAGRQTFSYTDLRMGNALESLVIKGGESAMKTLELVRPTPAELSKPIALSPQFNKLDRVFPTAWTDELLQSIGVRVATSLPARLEAGVVYAEKGATFVSDVQTTPLMLAIWKGEDRVADKLLSLGADPHVPTTFTLMVKVAPGKGGSGMAHDLRFATITLFPSQEAKRLGRALKAALTEPPSAPKQRLSLQSR